MTTNDTGTPLASGTTIGSYVIRQNLGADAQGYCYLADHPVHRSVLLHEFFAHEFAHREDRAMAATDAGDRVALRWWVRSYLDRANALINLRHPQLLRVLEAAEQQGGAYCASAAPDAPPLQAQLGRGALATGAVENLLLDLLDAADALHRGGFIHRAISPQTIWAASDGHATLGGFGSLRAAIRFKARMVHTVAPAPYAAPEETQADAQVTAAADIYAIATVVLHAASGQAPPTADQRLAGAALPSLAATGLSPLLATGIERALALDPAQRPQSIAQWREAMKLKSAAAAAAMAEAAAPARSKTAMLVGVPLLLIAAIAGVMQWQSGSSQPADRPAPVIAPIERAPTDADRPRFVSASLSSGDAAAALNQAAINTFSDEAASDSVATATAAPVVTAAPAPRDEARAQAGATVAASPARAAVADVPVTSIPAPAPPSAAPTTEVAVLTAPSSAPIAAAETQAPAETRGLDHAQQLALERSRCNRHVSELFAERDFTYADIARFDDVIKLDDGRLQTPKLRTDDGRRVSFLIDSQGCIVRTLR